MLLRKLFAALWIAMPVAASASDQAAPIVLGAAKVLTAPRSPAENRPADAPLRTAAMMARAAPTGQWYSNLMYPGSPEPVFAHPLTVRALPQGLEVALPVLTAVPTERKDTEIRAVHRDALIVSPAAFRPDAARLADTGDWSFQLSWAAPVRPAGEQGRPAGQAPQDAKTHDGRAPGEEMRATVAHGSPYAQFTVTHGGFTITLPPRATARASASSPHVLRVETGAAQYAAFAPSGSAWTEAAPGMWQVTPGTGRGYLSVAAMPDRSEASFALLQRHAYTFLRGTRVDWHYDAGTSSVTTRFSATTETMEAEQLPPLLGLYPHHWFENATVSGRLGPGYRTLRGEIRLLAASDFSTTVRYHGFVPRWPGVAESQSPLAAQLRDLMRTDLRNARRLMLEIGKGSYWQGKGLQRILKLADVFEAQGDIRGRDQLLELVRQRMQDWFSGEDRKTYFVLDRRIGTVLAHPEEYFSIEQMNDHHFHYGYWIRSAAEVALRDPAWAAADRWGPIVDLLVSDIATARRGGADFPFLRHFDPYEGHSWASGNAMGGWGNNQESSSEAVNAWAGLILWGELRGDKALRDLGIWLYTSEIEAIRHYWFDVHRLVLPKEYKSAEVSMLFGGKIAHNTWWTDEPRQIKGINLLPITTASTYLGRDPEFVRRSLATLDEESRIYASRGKVAKPADIWQDIFAKYLALVDPAAALEKWDRWGSFELGDTRSHALHWMLTLQQLGTPDFGVTADTTLYTVLRNGAGQRTYLAYNANRSPLTVRFSTGVSLEVKPFELRMHREARP